MDFRIKNLSKISTLKSIQLTDYEETKYSFNLVKSNAEEIGSILFFTSKEAIAMAKAILENEANKLLKEN